MKTLIKNISSLVTVESGKKGYKAGREMAQIGEIKNGALLFEKTIEWVGETSEAERLLEEKKIQPGKILDYSGKTVMPGFVDSHTHIVFAGDRTGEFGKRLRGASYKEIAQEGGGILTTMKGVRAASVEELAAKGRELALSAAEHGTTAIEIKSGYGLTTESEIKQLKAIKALSQELPMHVSPTFLGAHDFPPEYKQNRGAYIDIIINEMLPKVAEENLVEFCDAFIDEGFYTLEEGEKVLRAGLDCGLKLKVHCDELASFGASELAAGLGAASVDHLLFISDRGIQAVVDAGTTATLLPGTAYFIRMPYAPARKLIESGAIVALSTDCNPGSSFTQNMQGILSLAAINMNMTAEECIAAATINGAKAINKSEIVGSLEPGKRADFIVLDSPSYISMFYNFGINHVLETWIEGGRLEFNN